MFPLGTVLLPSAVLPLHVFEDRYRRMVADCLASGGGFGVVLIERGSEVGGGDVRTDVGTLARLVAAEEQQDGRWYLVAVGAERIKIGRWLPDDPYPRAEVETWPDPPAAPVAGTDAWQALVARARRVLALAAELGAAGADATIAFADDPALGTFQVASVTPLGPFDRQRVLTTEGSAARCDLLVELLNEAEELLRARLESS